MSCRCSDSPDQQNVFIERKHIIARAMGLTKGIYSTKTGLKG